MSLARYQTTPPAALGSFFPMRISYSNVATSVPPGEVHRSPSARNGRRAFFDRPHELIDARWGRLVEHTVYRLLDLRESFGRFLATLSLLFVNVVHGTEDPVRSRTNGERRAPRRAPDRRLANRGNGAVHRTRSESLQRGP